MPLPWVRLDTQFPSNPKVLALAEDRKWRALAVYAFGLSYCGAHGTDGFVPRNALPFVHGTTKEAADLVSVGLWHADRKGWLVNDWADYQQLQADAADALQAKRIGARKGNCYRWHGPDCGCWKDPPAGVA